MLRTCRVQARSKFWEGSLESLFIPWFLSFCSQIWEHSKLLFPFVIHYCSWLIEIAQLILLQYFSGNECHLFGCNQLCGFCRERLEREREMTGLVHESPVSSLVLPVVMRPILSGLERQDQGASQTLRAAFSKVLSHNKRLLPHNAFFIFFHSGGICTSWIHLWLSHATGNLSIYIHCRWSTPLLMNHS